MSGQDRLADTAVSLESAKEWLRERFEDGASCPCCHQHVKLYKRRLNGAMSYVLTRVYQWHEEQGLPVGKTDWLHVPSYVAKRAGGDPRLAAAVRGDWAKLKHWQMLEEKPDKRDDGSKRSGHYRITQRGIDFVNETISVQAYIWIYNETMLDRPVTERITIRDAMGIRFNYDDLMRNR